MLYRADLGALRMGCGGAPETTVFWIVPSPSTIIVTTSPMASGGGSCFPLRPQNSTRQPFPQVPDAMTSPARTIVPRLAYAIISGNHQAALARLSVPIHLLLTNTDIARS